MLRAYLSVFLVGCASTQYQPSVMEVRSMETRTFAAQYDVVFKAVVNALQDLHYTIDIVDKDVGLITASRQTTGKLGAIAREPDQTDSSDDGLPTWAKVALIVTGIVLVIALINYITDDDEDESDTYSESSDSFVIGDSSEPAGAEFYRYRVTVNLEALDDRETRIRVSGQGSRMKGNTVMETGPVYDPEFFQAFYANMDNALFLESTEQPLEEQ